MRRNSWLQHEPQGKRTIRSELERIPEYTRTPKNPRHGSFYLVNTKKARMEEQRNTEIEKNNRLLYEKIRKIMLKGRSHSENRSQSMINPADELHPIKAKDPASNGKMLLTFVKLSELPSLTPPPAATKLINQNSTRTNLRDILQHRSKFIDGYFQSIKEARQQLRNKPTEHLEKVVVGKWTVQGLIYDDCVVLKGICPERQLTKKYPYARVANKVRSDYQQWVKDKFNFEL